MLISEVVSKIAPWRQVAVFQAFLPRMRIRSQILVATILSLAILAGATVAWTRGAFLHREFDLVSEKHLLLANKLSLSLDRYLTDAAAIFEHVADNYGGQKDAQLLEAVEISAMQFYDAEAEIEFEYNPSERNIPYEVIADLIAQIEASDTSGTPVFSDLVNNNGDAFFLIVRKGPGGGFVTARLELDYVRELQASIRFGELGHSAIFDNKGFTIAHPIKAVEDAGMNASGISIVQQMMAGETGVNTFYSPPMNKDMVAGFTSVDLTGWGIMVPQPVEEIYQGVNRAAFGAYLMLTVFMFCASLVALLLSRSISGPIEKLADFSVQIAENGGADFDGNLVSKTSSSYEMDYLRQSLLRLIKHFRMSDEKLRNALEIEARESKFKDDFLISAGHELRNPLNGIAGMISVATEKNENPEMGRILGIASSSAKMMNYIIDELLVFSTDQRDEQPLYFKTVLMKDFCGDLAEVHRHFAEEKGLEFTTEFNFRRRVHIEIDHGKLTQILTNVLSNALKYTEEGSVHFGANLLETSELKTAELSFVISDTGIGISEENMQHIYEPFFRAESSYSRSHNGLGLGLAIVDKLCRRIGCTIRIESENGQGTTITLSLPVVVSALSDVSAYGSK